MVELDLVNVSFPIELEAPLLAINADYIVSFRRQERRRRHHHRGRISDLRSERI